MGRSRIGGVAWAGKGSGGSRWLQSHKVKCRALGREGSNEWDTGAGAMCARALLSRARPQTLPPRAVAKLLSHRFDPQHPARQLRYQHCGS
jgi:hypothetical protein